jgi:hypothetical protein
VLGDIRKLNVNNWKKMLHRVEIEGRRQLSKPEPYTGRSASREEKMPLVGREEINMMGC